MVAQRGKDLLLKLDHDNDGGFMTVAGLRSNKIAFNAQTIDVTHADSTERWRELLDVSGVRSASIAGVGIFKDATSDAAIRELFFSGEMRNWQVIVPDFGTVEGPFAITAFELSGSHDGTITFDLALESAGALTFQVIS